MGEYNTLGERIKNTRQKMGMNQTDLAKELNYTQAALSQYERGTREPGLKDLVNIANKLNTSTDYLLGRTEVLSEDVSIRKMGDYLGLTEASIAYLHEMYIRRKKRTEEEYILEELKFFTGTKSGDANFAREYIYIKGNLQQDLDDYTKALNQLVCSYEFSKLITVLTNNLFLERSIYDMLRIVAKRYDEIETFSYSESLAEQAYSLVDEGEDYIKQYLLNMFDMQNTIISFFKNFTKLEVINKADHEESFYKRIVFNIYAATRDMFENKRFSVEEMEKELSYIREDLEVQIEEILRMYKDKK